ncbi:MAG: DUF2318 domain-containing protein [Nanoarchaeota archaeon]|nr:DUF2318 domain-containing protein [Nanoarchaeota archaeon]
MKTKTLLIFPLILLLSGCTNVTDKTQVSGNIVNLANSFSEMKIPLSEITTQAKFYEYNANGKTVKFFAVKGSDGIIRTAFDACDVCGGYKGYRQEGTDMVCNNCGRHFSINSLGTKNLAGGGCWPTYLEHEIDSENIIIKESNLYTMKGVF